MIVILMTVGKIIANKPISHVVKMTVDKMTADKMTVDKMTVDKITVDQNNSKINDCM